MLPIRTHDQWEDNTSSTESSRSRPSMLSWQTWYSKRRRDSSSPSPPPRQDSSTSGSSSTTSSKASTRSKGRGFKRFRWSQNSQRTNTKGHPYLAQDSLRVKQPRGNQQCGNTLPGGQTRELNQLEQIISNCTPVRLRGRGSSVRLPEILPPQDFTAEELSEPMELSKPCCKFFVGHVFRPKPEPGWRVETKARSRESCLLTTRPLYSARRHSPLITNEPYTIYYEGDIGLRNAEDRVHLALGFVAKRDRTSLMPGSERGSIGIHFRNEGLYLNHNLLAKAIFKPGEQVGVGMTFSKSDVSTQDVNDAHPPAVSSSPISVEVFLARDGKKAGRWNLRELGEAGGLSLEGLEGNHDLYAAIGTLKAVNVDIKFDKRDWRYDCESS